MATVYGVCIHEAAHAVIALSLGFDVLGISVDSEANGECFVNLASEISAERGRAALVPSGADSSSADVCTASWDWRAPPTHEFHRLDPAIWEALTDDRRIELVASVLAGKLAERRHAPAPPGCGFDDEFVRMVLANLAEIWSHRGWLQANQIAERLLTQHWNSILTVSLELFINGRLTGTEVANLLRE